MRHQITINHNNSLGKAKPVCIDGVWYSSLNRIPGLSYNSIYVMKRKRNCSLEESIDYLLSIREDRERQRLAKKETVSKQEFDYHGEKFPSFSQCVRVIGKRNGIQIRVPNVYRYLYYSHLDKETGLDKYILSKKQKEV